MRNTRKTKRLWAHGATAARVFFTFHCHVIELWISAECVALSVVECRVTWLRNISYWLKEAMRLCVTLFYSQCRMMYVVTCSSLLCAFFLVVVLMQVDLSFICSLLLCLRPWDSALVCISVWNLCLPCAWIHLPSEGCFFPVKVWGGFFTMEKILWSSPIWSSVVIEPFLIL